MATRVKKPKDMPSPVQKGLGQYHNLTLDRDGRVWAWGEDKYGQCRIPEGMPPCTAISAGEYHSLALDRDGRVWAWGLNKCGQCNVPGGMPPCTAISAGPDHSLALDRDGRVWAWGCLEDIGSDDIPSELSDEGWLDLVAAYGNELTLTWAIPGHIRRLPGYKRIRALQRL